MLLGQAVAEVATEGALQNREKMLEEKEENLLTKHKEIQDEMSKVEDIKKKQIEQLEKIAGFSHIKVCGLMTIAPFVENPEENRPYFQRLRKLSVDIAAKKVNNVTMSILSMGMTNDFEVAVEEGATMVRVGTGLFGVRDYARI